ncbi:MAG: MFS transporter [Bacillota bacterium]
MSAETAGQTTAGPAPAGFRTFLALWASQSVSVFGTALTFFALTIWITQVRFPSPEQQPQLAASLAALGVAFALPAVFLAPFAGAWTDRYDRKRIMILTDIANAGVTLTILFLLVEGFLDVWNLIPLIALTSFIAVFHQLAFDASYVMIVPKEQLPRANGMMQTMWALSTVLSPAGAAAIIALSGTAMVFVVDAVTFVGAAVVLLFLRIPSPKRADLARGAAGRAKSLLSDVKEGALYILDRRPLLWLLATFIVANFAVAPLGVIQPMLVKYGLAADWTARGFSYEGALALLATSAGIGGVAGGFVVSTWGGLKRKRVYGVVVPLILAGVTQIVYGLSGVIFLTAGMALVMSAMVPVMNAHSQTIWQLQTPPELQGRVFSVRRLIAQCTWPLGTAVAGWAAGVVDPGVFMAILGGVLAVFCALQLANPYLLRIEDRDWLEDLARARGTVREARAGAAAGRDAGSDG